MYGVDDLLWDAIRMKIPEQFVSLYLVKSFHEVDEKNGNLFLMVSHFHDDAPKNKNLQIFRSQGSKSVLVWAQGLLQLRANYM